MKKRPAAVQNPMSWVRRIRRTHPGSASFPCQIPIKSIRPIVPYSAHASFHAIGEGVNKTSHRTMTVIQTRPNPAKNLRRRLCCCSARPTSRPPLDYISPASSWVSSRHSWARA